MQKDATMIAIKERYLTDDQGNRVAVVLDLETYRRLLEALEDQEDIAAADAALAEDPVGLPLADAWAEIEQERAAIGHNG
jgi:hypothetical protein